MIMHLINVHSAYSTYGDLYNEGLFTNKQASVQNNAMLSWSDTHKNVSDHNLFPTCTTISYAGITKEQHKRHFIDKKFIV